MSERILAAVKSCNPCLVGAIRAKGIMEEQPQESENQQESAEQRQKRYELLYAYAKMSYDEEKKRLDEAEAKAARLFPLIVLLLGVGSVGIKEAATTLEQFTDRSLIFLIPYTCFYGSPGIPVVMGQKSLSRRTKPLEILGLLPDDVPISREFRKSRFYLTSIGSIFGFLVAIAIRSVKSPSIERNVIEYFDRNPYLTIIYLYSRDFLSYARKISSKVDRKYTALKWAYWLLAASVILAFISTIGYVSLSSERVAMGKEKPDQQSQPPIYVPPPPPRNIDKGDKTSRETKTGKD